MPSIVHDPRTHRGTYRVLQEDDDRKIIAWWMSGKQGPRPTFFAIWTVTEQGLVSRRISRRFKTREAAEKRMAELEAQQVGGLAVAR